MTRDAPSAPVLGQDIDLGSIELRAWRSFLEAHAALVRVLENELKDREDLSLAWYDVLVQLHEAPDRRLRMQDLADAVLLSKSGLTRLVDRMEDAGLVERQACPTDRRGTFAVLTDAGRHTLARTAPAHLRGVAEHFAQHLTPEEAELLHDVFTRIGGALAD